MTSCFAFFFILRNTVSLRDRFPGDLLFIPPYRGILVINLKFFVVRFLMSPVPLSLCSWNFRSSILTHNHKPGSSRELDYQLGLTHSYGTASCPSDNNRRSRTLNKVSSRFQVVQFSYRRWGCFQTTQALKEGKQINIRQKIKDVHP